MDHACNLQTNRHLLGGLALSQLIRVKDFCWIHDIHGIKADISDNDVNTISLYYIFSSRMIDSYSVYTCIYIYIPVVPGQAGGGSFQKEKNYIAKKEFAYRMCARRPTSAMPKSFLCLCSPSAVPRW